MASLCRLLRPAAAPIEVEPRAMPATTTAIRAPVDHSEVLDWYDGAMAELDRTLRSLQVTPIGHSGGLYDNELCTDERGDAVVYVPVADPRAAGGCSPP